MSIRFEADALGLKQRSLSTPAWGRSTFFIDHTMTGQRLGSRRVSQRTTYHPRMAGPASQSGDMPIRSHPSARYLADDVQHGIAKRSCQLWRHSIRIIVHHI